MKMVKAIAFIAAVLTVIAITSPVLATGYWHTDDDYDEWSVDPWDVWVYAWVRGHCWDHETFELPVYYYYEASYIPQGIADGQNWEAEYPTPEPGEDVWYITDPETEAIIEMYCKQWAFVYKVPQQTLWATLLAHASVTP